VQLSADVAPDVAGYGTAEGRLRNTVNGVGFADVPNSLGTVERRNVVVLGHESHGLTNTGVRVRRRNGRRICERWSCPGERRGYDPANDNTTDGHLDRFS
jgi:hypothetical protein